MKFGIGWRLAWFASAIVLVAVAIGWTARTAWNEARQFRKEYDTAQVESFRIADYFQETILDLNHFLRRFGATQDPADWQKFVSVSQDLDRWIDVKTNQLKNPNERQILDRINNAYDLYWHEAREITNRTQLATEPTRVARFLDRAELQCKDLHHLANELAEAHREVVGRLILKTERSLALMQQIIFGLVVVLLALGAWVAVVVYRDMIAPLRVRLVEARAIMERQEKLASLGILAAGVAHEIRNPLTAIKARLFTQHKRLAPGSAEADDADVINSEINRLERIVKGVLQFAKPAEPNLSPVLAEIPMREACELMAPQLEKNGIKMELEMIAPVKIRADVEQIKQVLINLIQNAADSIGQNGTVTLRVRQPQARARGSANPMVVLEVEDTGKGITPEVQKRLFDPFFTTKEGGTGLGLSIAARIVEMHGGSLGFQTSLDRGTLFGIVLPQYRSDEATL